MVRSGRHASTRSWKTPWSIGDSRLQSGQRSHRGNGVTGTSGALPLRHDRRGQQSLDLWAGCGECGLSITAEEQVNRHGKHYIYYHCTKRRLDYRCLQPYVSLAPTLRPRWWHSWKQLPYRILSTDGYSGIDRASSDEAQRIGIQPLSLAQAQASLDRELDNLTKLRVRDLLTDEEYTRQREQLQRERIRDAQKLNANADWFEPAREFISFSNQAVSWFVAGDIEMKRLILEIVGLI